MTKPKQPKKPKKKEPLRIIRNITLDELRPNAEERAHIQGIYDWINDSERMAPYGPRIKRNLTHNEYRLAS